jgi:hypothetical protein
MHQALFPEGMQLDLGDTGVGGIFDVIVDDSIEKTRNTLWREGRQNAITCFDKCHVSIMVNSASRVAIVGACGCAASLNDAYAAHWLASLHRKLGGVKLRG